MNFNFVCKVQRGSLSFSLTDPLRVYGVNMTNIQFSDEAKAIALEIEKNIKALEEGGIPCDRCGGQGVCNHNPNWINTRLTDRREVTRGGKVCFKCRGAGTIGLAKKQRASVLACGYAYYNSITYDGVVDFGSIINQYRKWENSVWHSVMKPLYHHINRVVVAQALQGNFVFQGDDQVFDPRCYSFYPYAMQFLDLFPMQKQREIVRHAEQVSRQRSRGGW